MDKTRFDIKYDQTPGRERFTVRCNFPALELGAARIARTWQNRSAWERWMVCRGLAEEAPEKMEAWIVGELGVGSKNFTPPAPKVLVAPEVARAFLAIGRSAE